MDNLVSISFAGPDRVGEAHLVGNRGNILSVCLSVNSDLTNFQLEFLNQTFRIGRWLTQDYARPLFWSKGQKVKGHGDKNMVFG